MSIQDQQRKELINAFNDIAHCNNRASVFHDFVSASAIAIHNQFAFNQKLEDEYLSIVNGYERNDVEKLCRLLGQFSICLINNPHDLLGEIYMELEIGCSGLGQFFTSPSIQRLLSRLACTDIKEELATKSFISVSEPACGSNGHIIEFAEEMKVQGYQPSDKLFAYCIDIDRTAVFMSYLQLSILEIPAVIYHGNTLTMEMYSAYYTPAFYKHRWDERLEKDSMKAEGTRLLDQLCFDLSA